MDKRVELTNDNAVWVDTIYTNERKIQLHADAYSAYFEMLKYAEQDGIDITNVLLIASGYRSDAQQQASWERALKTYGSEQAAREWVAKPGSSSHRTGRAIDFILDPNISNSSKNVEDLINTATYDWLFNNAKYFGFFQYEKEPWHWEFNPIR